MNISDQESILDSFEKLDSSFDAKNGTMVDKSLALHTNNQIDFQIEQMIEKNEGMWKCKVCAKIANRKQDIERLAETHIEGVSHVCHIRSKTFKTRDTLLYHSYNIHSEL